MFKVKKKGPWKQVSKLMSTMPRRVERVKHELVRGMARRFMEDMKAQLPDTPEMEQYKDSLQLRALTGPVKKDEVSYAIFSDPKEMEVAHLNEKEAVVYVEAKLGKLSELSQLAIDYSPWTVDQLPRNLPGHEVRFVHRQVTEGEVDEIRERNLKTIQQYSAQFTRAGAKFDKADEIDQPATIPDLAFQAIRMEFGIGQKPVRHWSYALHRFSGRIKEMTTSPSIYGKHVEDPNFTGWRAPMGRVRKMTLQDFLSKCKEFQERVTKM